MKFKIFRNLRNLRYGLSERKDGFMNVKISEEPERELIARKNRQRFFERHDIKGKIFIPHLVHGGRVAIVSEENWQEGTRADGFVTISPNIFLTITVADCFPLYFYDPVKQVIGLAHGGWRSVVKNITKNVISKFVESFQSNPKNILLAIGPGIQKCHFVVRGDVVHQFKLYSQFIKKEGNGYFIDLPGIITNQARKEGIITIESSNLCTHCLSDTYFSYRRDKPEFIEVMLAYMLDKSSLRQV